MRRGVHTSRLLCVMSLLPGVAAGQARGSLAVGAGRVHYEDSIRFSSAAISPAFEFDSPTLTANLWGTFASLPFGRWSSQGRADLWTVTPPAFGGLRLGVETIGAGTIRTDGGWSAAAHGIAEVLWAAPRWGIGVGAGPSAGWIAGAPSVTALHTRGRMWARIGAATYSVSAEPTRFLGAWFTDVSAAVALSTGPVTTSLWASRRLSTTYGSRSAGSALVQVFPTSTVAIELGGGSYLPEPYQGLPRASYVTVGIRLFAVSPRPAAQSHARTLRWPPLIPERRGDSVIVRFGMEGAAAVAIAGDWDDWRPRDLRPLGADLWEGALSLRPGTYHFNLQVDHRDWVVPGGVAIADGLGGMVGVLVVP
ncbi:MAG: glycogen-binding domain-containing protein [Gemmatimonadota bacterium]